MACIIASSISAQVVPEPSVDLSSGRAAWLDEAKYGMFIHWGVYSTLANGEWVMCRTKIPVAKYKEMASKFNPTNFGADEWVAVAKKSGMKYITITSKQHDGFAMFDSDASDYNIVDHTPFKRDVLRELKEASGKAGRLQSRWIMELAEVVSKGGSFLFNVGPTSAGLIPQPAIKNLEVAGDWLKVNGEAIYGARGTIFEGEGQFITRSAAEETALDKEALATGAGKKKKGHKQKDYAWLATGRDGKLYLHFFQWPTEPFVLHGFENDKVTGAYFLADSEKAPVQFSQIDGTVTINLPAQAIDELSTVLCLTLDK